MEERGELETQGTWDRRADKEVQGAEKKGKAKKNKVTTVYIDSVTLLTVREEAWWGRSASLGISRKREVWSN